MSHYGARRLSATTMPDAAARRGAGGVEETATCRVTVASGGVLTPFLDASGDLPGLVCAGADGADHWRLVRLASSSEKLGNIASVWCWEPENWCAPPAFCPAGQTLTIAVSLLMPG